jgi:hypothetical protein
MQMLFRHSPRMCQWQGLAWWGAALTKDGCLTSRGLWQAMGCSSWAWGCRWALGCSSALAALECGLISGLVVGYS